MTADRGTNGTSPTPGLRRQGACHWVSAGGSDGRRYQRRAEVQKDDSAGVTRVYRLDDLVVYGDDGGLYRVTRSAGRGLNPKA